MFFLFFSNIIMNAFVENLVETSEWNVCIREYKQLHLWFIHYFNVTLNSYVQLLIPDFYLILFSGHITSPGRDEAFKRAVDHRWRERGNQPIKGPPWPSHSPLRNSFWALPHWCKVRNPAAKPSHRCHGRQPTWLDFWCATMSARAEWWEVQKLAHIQPTQRYCPYLFPFIHSQKW